MSNWGYVILGWAATGGVVGLYSARLILRGRSLSRQVPEGQRRWMS